MFAGQILYSLLSNYPAVSAIVGNSISPIRTAISADQLPLIVYEADNDSQGITMQGESNLICSRVRVACMAVDYDDATALGLQVYNALHDLSAVVVDGSILVSRIFYKGHAEEEQTLPGTGDDISTYLVIKDFDIWYYLPQPAAASSSSSSSSTSSLSSLSSLSSWSSDSSSSSTSSSSISSQSSASSVSSNSSSSSSTSSISSMSSVSSESSSSSTSSKSSPSSASSNSSSSSSSSSSRSSGSSRSSQSSESSESSGHTPAPGPTVWLKADAGVLNSSGTTATNGQSVGTWLDQSGNGFNATGVSGSYPTFHTGVYGGLPAVRFDGSSSFLEVSGLFAVSTVFVVWSTSTNPFPAWACVYSYRTSAGGDRVPNSDENGQFGCVYGANEACDYFGNTTAIYQNGASQNLSNFSTYPNGVPLDSPTGLNQFSQFQTSASNHKYISIGADTYNPDGTRVLTGDIVELLIYNTTLTAAQQQQTEHYLLTKWGI